MNIHNINREDLQDFINYMFDNGYSRNTLSSVIGILSKSLNYAADDFELIDGAMLYFNE